MKRILVAVDGSECSLRALRAALEEDAAAELHLVNVQPTLTGTAARHVGRAAVEDYHRDEGMKELEAAIAAARAAGVEAQPHVVVGDPGQTIARFASQIGADRIVIGSKGRGAIPDAVLGSAVRGVLQHSPVPVLVVK